MANNFNKVGYSTTEVAQILKCTPTTVRGYINRKKLEALGSDDRIARDHRRTLRITRESLTKFLSENRSKYPKELVSQFVKDDTDLTAEEKQYCTHDLDLISTNSEWPPKGSYTAESVQELKGAFSQNNDDSKRLESPETDDSKRLDTYKLTVNGSTIPDLKKDTVQKIVNALLDDDDFKLKTLMIWRRDNK